MNALTDTVIETPAPPPGLKIAIDSALADGTKPWQILMAVKGLLAGKAPESLRVVKAYLRTLEARK